MEAKMASIKVKNVSSSLVIVPNGKGGDIIIPPQSEAEIDEKYLAYFSGKLVKLNEDKQREENPDNKEEKTRGRRR